MINLSVINFTSQRLMSKYLNFQFPRPVTEVDQTSTLGLSDYEAVEEVTVEEIPCPGVTDEHLQQYANLPLPCYKDDIYFLHASYMRTNDRMTTVRAHEGTCLYWTV